MTAAGLGRDLRVLLGPPGLAAHDAEVLDLRVAPRPSRQRRPPAGGDAPTGQGFAPEPPGAAEVGDLATIEGRANVAQALTLRLLTPRGSLAALGHAEYGSRLPDLIGRRKTEALRGLCRAHILEAVRHEPRVADRPLAITFHPEQEPADAFVVEIVVQPVDGTDPVAVAVEVAL